MKQLFFILIGLVIATSLSAQQKERKHVRKGNKQFDDGNFKESEIQYRKALEQNPEFFDAQFNLADAIFKQGNYEEALERFNQLAEVAQTPEQKHKVMHNIGNTLLTTNKLDESIDAYKEALRNNPSDLETKYNLAFAQDKKKQQQQQQQQNKDKNQNKDQNKDQDKKDQNQDQNKDKKDQDKDKDKKDQNKDQNKDKKKQDQKQQQQKGKISKKDAQRLLQALENDEKKTQEKVKKQKAKAKKKRAIKEW